MSWLRWKQVWKRTISVITILALLLSAMPVSLAAGNDAPSSMNSINRGVAGDFIAADGETEATPTPEEPTATPEPTPTETPVAEVTPEPEVSVDPSATPEETVTPEPSLSPSPSPLPYGFAGMPEGYVLSADELDAKEIMSKKDILSTTESLTPGEDYVPNQIMFWADSQEYAEMVAAAYSGVLAIYSDHIAVVELQTATVVEALSVASDMSTVMPAVDANHIIRLDPDEDSNSEGIDPEMRAQALPQLKTWYDKPNDPFLVNPASSNYQWVHDAINTYEAWTVTTGSSSIKVAVVDSGVLATHEDLVGKVQVVSMTDITGDPDTDTAGHGTHVAGIIAAASGNGKGGAGIAPGVKILSVAALPYGGGDDAVIAIGIGRAVTAGADIINMSFGSYAYNAALNASIQNAINHNVTCIAAMGNDGSNSYRYPAAYSNVIAVSAVDPSLRRANFSNYGSWADIAAPGVDIISSVNNSTTAYGSKGGTSMAAPVVSGVAALYMSKAGRVSPSAMEKKLESCVNKSSSSSIGAGVIDAAKLFSTEKTAPVITIKSSLNEPITNFTLPIALESTLSIAGAEGSLNAKVILYTTDGTTPSFSNGEVKNGAIYSSAISLASMQAGKAITVKAICVNEMGIMSSVASVKFTLAQSSSISSLSISGVSKITAGGSTTFTASVLPVASVSQKVIWSIYTRSGAVKATLSSTGVLKTAVNDGGSVTIRATSAVNNAKYVDKVVTVDAIPFIKKISLNPQQIAFNFKIGDGTNWALEIASAINTSNESVNPATLLCQWSSSNTKVATVNQSGVVTAVGKGTATIKCLVLDGSNKYATCAIIANPVAESISVSGQLSIAPGKTGTYKATILPTVANPKAFVWSLPEAPAGVKISTSGVVSVPSSVTSGSIVVRATTEGSGLISEMSVSIAAQATSISLTSSDSRVTRNSSATITGATIFTLNIASTAAVDNILQLGYLRNGNNTTPIWSSSSPTVASVDQNGKVIGLKAGSTTITCATRDGSGKKATMKVTVAIPTAYITVNSKAAMMLYDTPGITFGKSVGNTVSFGDTYGVPSIKKVNWSFKVYETDSSGNSVYDWTNYYKANKRVSVNSSGTLSVSSSMLKDWIANDYNLFRIVLTASATDGSNASGSITYIVVPATAAMFAKYSQVTFYVSPGYKYDLQFWSYNLSPNFSVTSSNPEVVGFAGNAGHVSGNLYYATIYIGKSGTASITIKANDGSGKSCTTKIVVIN